MIILVLFLLGFAAILAGPVLLLMNQIFLSTVIETAGIAILTCVLVREGLIGMFGLAVGALCVGVPGLLYIGGTVLDGQAMSSKLKREVFRIHPWQGRWELMIKILFAFLATACLLACPVLLIMNQMYVGAGLGVGGVALAVGLLVTIGDGKHG